jgi:lysophospholipase L1-like esterase
VCIKCISRLSGQLNLNGIKTVYRISLGINLLIFAGVVYLVFNGKHHAGQLIYKYIIEVRYKQKCSMFAACPVTKGAVIFLGNSITEGGNWSELFPGKPVLNRGIGGDVTAGVLARMDEIVRHEPSKLFICIGTNDLAKGVDVPTILANYSSIIRTVKEKSPATAIYVQSVLPVGRTVVFSHDNAAIPPLNKEIQQLCAAMQVTFIDLHSVFAGADGYLKSGYTNDNLHLMGEAYLAWKDKIEMYLNE